MQLCRRSQHPLRPRLRLQSCANAAACLSWSHTVGGCPLPVVLLCELRQRSAGKSAASFSSGSFKVNRLFPHSSHQAPRLTCKRARHCRTVLRAPRPPFLSKHQTPGTKFHGPWRYGPILQKFRRSGGTVEPRQQRVRSALHCFSKNMARMLSSGASCAADGRYAFTLRISAACALPMCTTLTKRLSCP